MIASSGAPSQELRVLVTDGGSAAMEVAIMGACGQAGSRVRALMLIDPAYSDYAALAARIVRRTI